MAVDPQQQPPQPPPPSSPHRHRPPISLQPSHKSSSRPPSKPAKLLRRVRSVFRSFPIITPASCKMPGSLQGITRHHGGVDAHIHGGTRMTGTLFGFRKARVNLALQENPRCLPSLVLELAIPTGKLLQDMGTGMVRIALECERHPSEKTRIAQEPIWALYCNGRKSGYAVRREATEDDLVVMQLLNAVSMGAGVLPTDHAHDHQDGELTYMRAFFERVVGSRDSETYHMMSPDQSAHNGTTELSIFFVRI